MNVTSLHVYPVKSFAGNQVAYSAVEPRGLRGDRRWMLVDSGARFLTARQLPRMLNLVATPTVDGLRIHERDGDACEVATPAASAKRIHVTIWKSTSSARVADAATNAWLSQRLGQEVRLVHMADDCVRTVDDIGSVPGDIVSFADGYPLLLIGTASLDLLNSKLERPVSMANFRPNLVVKTDVAHVEDRWQRIRIGSVEFAVSKACTRCVLTTIDPESAIRAADGEPLATLKSYRREAIGVTFGQNLLVRSEGTIARGAKVEVLEQLL